MLHVADARGDGHFSGILAFLGFPITANRMPKRGIGKGAECGQGEPKLWGGVWHYFLLWSESVNGAWKDDDD